MPKRGKESRSSSRHSGGQFSPPLPLSSRQPRNDYQIAGPSRIMYQMSQCATDKPRFRGPETDVLHDLEKDKLKNIRVQMIRADVQQNDSFRKAYVIEESAASRSKVGLCFA